MVELPRYRKMNAGWIAAFIASARRAIPNVVYAFGEEIDKDPLVPSHVLVDQDATRILFLRIFITSLADPACG